MQRDELLKLLEDVEVRRIIRQIMHEDELSASNTEKCIAAELHAPQGTNETSSSSFAGNRMLNESEQAVGARQPFEEHYLSENNRLKEELTQAIKEKDAAIQRECDCANRASDEKNKLQEANNSLKRKYDDLKKQNVRLKDDNKQLKDTVSILENENKELTRTKGKLEKEKNALETQLSQRFAQGWELFEEYQTISPQVRQRLSGVFTQENSFMSFICGGAQTSALETIWDVLRECVQQGKADDASTLWDIFEYCLQLVNASKIQARYETLPVEEGDTFDMDYHSEGQGSKAQGTIADIYLRGFRNSYNGKVIRKSIVRAD